MKKSAAEIPSLRKGSQAKDPSQKPSTAEAGERSINNVVLHSTAGCPSIVVPFFQRSTPASSEARLESHGAVSPVI